MAQEILSQEFLNKRRVQLRLEAIEKLAEVGLSGVIDPTIHPDKALDHFLDIRQHVMELKKLGEEDLDFLDAA